MPRIDGRRLEAKRSRLGLRRVDEHIRSHEHRCNTLVFQCFRVVHTGRRALYRGPQVSFTVIL